MANKKCPTCGTENAGEAKFCFGCGEKFDISVQTAVAPAPGDGPTVCPKCKTPNAPNATFCARCGANLSEAIKEEKAAPMVKSVTPEVVAEEAAPAPKAGVCRKCNFENNPESKFCARCGAKLLPPAPPKPQMPQMPKVEIIPGKCNKCGTQNDPDFAFCSRCGSKLGGKPKGQGFTFSGAALLGNMSLRDIIRNGVLLLLAILMTVFSFLPVFKYEVSEEIGEEELSLDFNFSAVDAVTLLLDSFKDEDEDIEDALEELQDAYAEDLEEATDDLDYTDEDDLEKIQKITIELTEKYAGKIGFLTIRSQYATEDYTTKLRDFVGGVAAILYIVAAVAFLAFAILNFVFALLGKKSFFKLSVSLMCLLASIVPAISYAIGTMVGATGSIGLGGTLIMIFAFVGVAALLGERFIIDRCGVNVRAVIVRAISAALVGVMLILSSSAIATVKVDDAKYKKGDNIKETDISIGLSTDEFNQMFDLSEEEIEAFPKKITTKVAKQMLEGVEDRAKNVFASYTKSQIEDGDADSAIYPIAQLLVVVSGGRDMAPILALASVVTFLMTLAAGLILWQTLFAIANGSSGKKAINIARIFNVIFAAATLVFAIMFILFAKSSIDLVKAKDLSAGIGTGIIFYTVFAIAHFFVPFGKKNVEEILEYDEDDFAA